jgi:hypothetical protein
MWYKETITGQEPELHSEQGGEINGPHSEYWWGNIFYKVWTAATNYEDGSMRIKIWKILQRSAPNKSNVEWWNKKTLII